MTQEEKSILLRDLCGRLPYKPRVRYYYHSIGSSAINGYSDEGYLSYQNLENFSLYQKYGLDKTRVYNISPYLRPMSSMTEEEREFLKEISAEYLDEWVNAEDSLVRWRIDGITTSKRAVFYNSHHLDWNNLIPMGLALEAPEGMYD